MENSTKLTKFNLFAVLMVSFLCLYEIAVVSPAIGEIAKAFPNFTLFQLRSIATTPFISVFIFSIVSGFLARKFDKKKIMIVGLLLYGIAGFTPVFTTNITVILILRFLTGIGVGLTMPLPNAIISQHYSGDQRQKYLGYAMAMTNGAAIIASIVIGFLLVLWGWKTPFYSFAFVFVVLIIVIFGAPKSMPENRVKDNTVADNKPISHLPPTVFVLAFIMLFTWMIFAFIPTNLAIFCSTNSFIPVWAMGIIVAISGTLGAIVSAFIVPITKLFKKYIIFASFVLWAIGFFILANATTLATVVISLILAGIGSGIITPVLLNQTAMKTGPETRDVAFGLVTSCIHLGSFFSAYAMSLIAILANDPSLRFLFKTGGFIIVVAAVVSLLALLFSKKEKGNVSISN